MKMKYRELDPYIFVPLTLFFVGVILALWKMYDLFMGPVSWIDSF